MGHGNTTAVADGPQPLGAIMPRTRQHHPDGVALVDFGQRGKKKVDGQVEVPFGRRAGAELEHPVVGDHHFVAGQDINMVGLHGDIVRYFQHRQGRNPLQDVGQQAFVAGGQVLHQHVGHARLRRNGFDQFLERFQPARRGTDARHRKQVLGQDLFVCFHTASAIVSMLSSLASLLDGASVAATKRAMISLIRTLSWLKSVGFWTQRMAPRA